MVDHILFQINNELFFTFWMSIISMKSNKFENCTKNGGGKGFLPFQGFCTLVALYGCMKGWKTIEWSIDAFYINA